MQLLKGEKLKSLMTELKAHEKLVLALKKRRHTKTEDRTLGGKRNDVKLDKDWDNWDGSSFAHVPSVAESPIDPVHESSEDEERLDQDLRQILSRFHLTESLASRSRDSKPLHNDDDFEGSDNHINSVKHQLSIDPTKKRKRFSEPGAVQLFKEAEQLAQDVAAATASHPSEQQKEKQRAFDQWFASSLERDIDVLEGRLNKVRHLERQLEEERTKARAGEAHNAIHWDSKDVSSIEDLKKRLKDMRYKASKSEKEIRERIISRRHQEFPTSRGDGEL